MHEYSCLVDRHDLHLLVILDSVVNVDKCSVTGVDETGDKQKEPDII